MCGSIGGFRNQWASDIRIVCAVGAESTGKTTLCRELATHFGVPWLSEYAREYLDGTPYQQRDVEFIAREQTRREAELLANTVGGVVLDTDLAVILIWWREKYGAAPPWLAHAFAAQAPRLYLLCRPDLPWQPDPLRESPDDLGLLHERYLSLLTEKRLPFAEIGGVGETRLEQAIAAARPCLTVNCR